MMFCKIRDFINYKKIKGIRKDFNKNKSFDVRAFDKRIAELAGKIDVAKLHKIEGKGKRLLGAIATFLHNNGGHSVCVFNFIKSFCKDYDTKMFLVNLDETINKHCAQKINNVTDCVELLGINTKKKSEMKDIVELYNKIIDARVKVLFSFVHPDDVVSAVVFYLLQKNSDVKIVFFNHMDHFPALGMMFCEKIIDFRPAMVKVTNEVRGYDNNVMLALQAPAAEDTKYFSQEEIDAKRKELGVSDGEFLTITGCAAYKLFDGDKSTYFEMIRDLLKKEPKIQHRIVTGFNEQQKAVFDKVFVGSDVEDRVKIVPFSPQFDILFQACDLFIDSFPQGSALTHVDMMRNKRPTVVWVDRVNPQTSFECYLPDNYEYAFDNTKDMIDGVIRLLNDKNEQARVVEELYKHYLKNFEFYAVKDKYKQIIEDLW